MHGAEHSKDPEPDCSPGGQELYCDCDVRLAQAPYVF
jgi:hypothetical protein